MHRPVLLQQAIENLAVRKDGKYIDATLGEGGHALEIVRLGGIVLGIDMDPDQIAAQKTNILPKNLILAQGNFKDIKEIAKENNFYPVDGILIDLGLSMGQITGSGRGFSYKNLDEALDMRISKDNELKAAAILNNFSEDELYEVFARYSEELNSRPLAKNIVIARRQKPFKKVSDLLAIIDSTLQKKDTKVYSRIFQSLRIAVNDEFDNLKSCLEGGSQILKSGGRMVVISFHSLEDRIVKEFIRQHGLNQLNKKVITSDSGFKFERSAKMRVIGRK